MYELLVQRSHMSVLSDQCFTRVGEKSEGNLKVVN